MSTVWRKFPGHSLYSVSDDGRVRNDRTKVERQPIVDERGYLRVTIHEDGRTVTLYIHRLVAELFLPDWRPGVQITFRNNIRGDCRVENLRIRETLKSTRRGETERPSVQASRVLIVELDEVFRNAVDAANRIGGDASAIYKCLRNQRLSHRGYTFEPIDAARALRYRRREQLDN